MTDTVAQSILEPGDALLYFENSLVDWAIAIKTFTRIGHIEIYKGNGISTASRNGIGVNVYPLRLSGLVCVRRPIITQPLNFVRGNDWFETYAKGQKYDFKGLLCYTLAVSQGARDRMYCSEYAIRQYRKMDFEPFNPEWDADRTPPAMFYQTGSFRTIWQKQTKI